jgi:beta-lactamase regulating signal transducer with metallopeptidase domain
MTSGGFPAWAVFIIEEAFPFLMNLLAHSTVLIALGLLVSHAVRDRGAALQSLVLRMTLIGVLLCPLVSVGVNRMGMEDFTVSMPRTLVISGDAIRESAVLVINPPALLVRAREAGLVPGSAVNTAAMQSGKVVKPERRSGMEGWIRFIAAEIVMISVSLTFFMLLNLTSAFRLIRHVLSSASEAAPGLIRKCTILAESMGVRPPPVFVSACVRSPFITGVFRPVVLLPRTNGCNEAISRDVLVHELAHLARRDCI